ncbi:EF-hand calcium-binding domain-containing protein 10 [Perognathus longimembris pacificus]|uniref:EF-hand calcium-binding domain-containing protein 10 n=1 Tax=Perognathus longimembris pacificus TaxID=214514 RepID=UPI002018912C|nr:EF-hand calcium-binding domain-containing protein 10 [Perognathus longimembris pacificus]
MSRTLPSRLATAQLRAMESVSSPERQAREYLEKHRIMDMLNYLTSMLLFSKPEKPREFLMSLLERMRIAKVTSIAFPYFMDNTNIMAMFEMLDSAGKGNISFVQYKEALKTLGLSNEDEVFQDDGHVITLENFKSEVNKRTEAIWLAF